MTDYTLAVTKAATYERLDALTHYTAAKNDGDEGAFERVATIAANSEIFDLEWPQVVAGLLPAFNPWVTATASTDGEGANAGLYLTLTLPDTWPSALQPALQQTVGNYILARLAELWFRKTLPDAVEVQVADAAAALAEARILLHHRKRPQLPPDYRTED